MDERSVAVKVRGKGVVVFSGCSHAGIVNVVRDVQQKLGAAIYMIMGGLHLAGSPLEPRIDQTMADLKVIAPSLVAAGHCTGWKAKMAIEKAMPGTYVACGAGCKIVVKNDEEMAV